MSFKTKLLSLFSATALATSFSTVALAQSVDDSDLDTVPEDQELDNADLDDQELGATTQLETERVPGWTLDVGYMAQDMGFRNEAARVGDYDFQGLSVGAGRDSKMSEMTSTTSRLFVNYAQGDSDLGLENNLTTYAAGYEQRFNYDMEVRNTLVRPFVGAGVSLGRFDNDAVPFSDDDNIGTNAQRNYLKGALSAGANVTLPNGIKPFVKYEWSVAELNEGAALDFGDIDDIGNFRADMSVNTLVAGLGYNF